MPAQTQNQGHAPASPDLAVLTSVTLWPQQLNANGMFIAAWKRR
jgi:hypothetical protein